MSRAPGKAPQERMLRGRLPDDAAEIVRNFQDAQMSAGIDLSGAGALAAIVRQWYAMQLKQRGGA